MWPTATAPTGFLLCNGALVSRATYAALFAIVGTIFGSGDGSTTFTLPDYRDRMPIGAGTTYTAAITGGSKDTTVVSHTHTATSTVSDPGHVHSITASGGGVGEFRIRDDTGLRGTYNTSAATTGITVATTNASTGVSGTNANLPPYLGIFFIIKT
jgi:microcystin-dependent protein